MNLLETLEKLGQGLEKLIKNPLVDHGIDWAGDYIMGHAFWQKIQQGDQTNRGINPNWLRREAPKAFAETHLDENLLREITYSRHLARAYRTILFDNWGPSPVPPADPAGYNPLVGEVGPHQWDDIRLSLVEELVPLTDKGEREAKIKELGEFLTELAKIGPVFRLRRFIRLNYCKPLEGDYRIVQIERFIGRRFQNLADFRNWVTDPAGLRQFVANAARQIDARATAAAPKVFIAANFTTRSAANINAGTNRGLFGLGRFLR